MSRTSSTTDQVGDLTDTSNSFVQNNVMCTLSGNIYIYIYIVVSLVTLRSSGTDILYGCHLLLDVCIIYFISCDSIMNSSLSYTIYIKNC